MRNISYGFVCLAVLSACSSAPGGNGGTGAGGYPGGAPGAGGGQPGGGVNGGGGVTNIAGNMGSGLTGSGAVVGGGGMQTGGGGISQTGTGGTIVTGTGGASAGGGNTGGASGATGTGGGSVGGAGTACAGQNLPANPDDPSARGPWVVGVKTVSLDRMGHSGEKLTVEIEYPAAAGSEQGKPEATYDVRDWLPKDAVQPDPGFTPIPDSESPAVKPIGDKLYRDLPIDDTHGPYPVIVFMHGTASFRIASGSAQSQWASRGFIVVAADYPGLVLTDELCFASCGCPSRTQDFPNDFQTQFNALKTPTGDLAFLANHLDMTHVGLSGHSVGGCTTAAMTTLPNVQIVIPLSSAAPVTTSPTLKSLLFFAGMADKVFAYGSGAGLGNFVCTGATGSITDAYTASPSPAGSPPVMKKRLVGVTGGGHLVPSDLCQPNANGDNAIQVMGKHFWCGSGAAGHNTGGPVALVGLAGLFDCGATGFDWKTGVNDMNYATTAAFEETLQCRDRTAAFANLKTALPSVGDFKEAM
jgi:hypothetical protein